MNSLLRWMILNWPSRFIKGRMLNYLIATNPPQEGEFRATIENTATIDLRHSEAIGKVVAALGTYEPGELRYIQKTVELEDTVIDIGANIGVFTVLIAKWVGPKGRVISVEPHPENVVRLKNHLDLNALKNVDVLPLALGTEVGILNLISGHDQAYARTADNSGLASQPSQETQSIQVSVTTLDRIWMDAGSPKIRMIKIDVEGAELNVLKGGTQLLRQCKPTLLIEANDREQLQSIQNELAKYSYHCKSPRRFARYNYLFVGK